MALLFLHGGGAHDEDRPLALHHCRDDATVEFEHLALNAALLPSAAIHAHDPGGHQFEGTALDAVAADLRAGTASRPAG